MARSFKGKTFSKILRGYSPEEVDEYIAYIDVEYKKLEKAHDEKSRRLSLALGKLDEMNNYAEELENQLDEQTKTSEKLIAKQKQQLILLAKQLEKFANQPSEANPVVGEKAKQEAEMIVADAQLKGEKIIAEAEEIARNLREKIITEATARAEQIVLEAERNISGNSQVTDDMNLAAVDIYNEICAFRDTLFAAYNAHIESIEEITAAAEVLIADVGSDAGLSYEDLGEDEPESMEEEFCEVEEAEEVLSEVEEFAAIDKIDEDVEILETVDDAEADDFAAVAEVFEEQEDILADDNGFVELADEDGDYPTDDTDDIWAEYFDGAVTDEAHEETVEEIVELVGAEIDTTVTEAQELTEDTYEPYETYGETPVEESDENIELEAQKYSDVYTDDFDDDDGSYAPNAEFAWGDDMYAEIEEDQSEDFEELVDFDAETGEDFEELSDFEEDLNEDFAVAEDSMAADEEIDELDKLKQFFSANYDEDLAKSRTYDTASNSTTSIALSLNDFFEEEEDMISDFSLAEAGDVEDLFEKLDDPMSVTDEFNIIFGHMDDMENIAEIRRQPIIPAEEPKNPKKHGKF